MACFAATLAELLFFDSALPGSRPSEVCSVFYYRGGVDQMPEIWYLVPQIWTLDRPIWFLRGAQGFPRPTEDCLKGVSTSSKISPAIQKCHIDGLASPFSCTIS